MYICFNFIYFFSECHQQRRNPRYNVHNVIQKFVSEDLVQALATNTNEYSFQNDERSVNTNTKEIQAALGMYLRMEHYIL